MIQKALRLISVAALSISCLYMPTAAAEELLALVADQVIDGDSERALDSKVVLVRDNKIEAVVDSSEIPEGARVINFEGMTLLPGMIDGLNHPLISHDDYQSFHLHKSSAYKTLMAYKAIHKSLGAGWTTLFAGGTTDVYYGINDLKTLQNEGVLGGPRLVTAAHYLSVTGGGGDINYFSPEQKLIADGRVVDGPEEIRKAIREEAKYGSDWLKVLVTGAYMSVGDDPNAVQFSEEEFQAIMDEANRQGMPVMAHAHAADGIKMAARMGARAVAHGSFMDDEAIKLMKKNGTYLVPTLFVGDYYADPRYTLREQDRNDYYMEHERTAFFARVNKAYEAGVKIVAGIDLGGYNYDPTVYAREMALLIEAGMEPMAAIKASTSTAADMLKMGDQVGRLKEGFLADIIAVPGNPLEDISELEKVRFVMLNGEIIKHEKKGSDPFN